MSKVLLLMNILNVRQGTLLDPQRITFYSMLHQPLSLVSDQPKISPESLSIIIEKETVKMI